MFPAQGGALEEHRPTPAAAKAVDSSLLAGGQLVEERSLGVAVLRRVWDLVPVAGTVPVPWVFHFDGALPDGTPVFSHTRRWGLRDRYLLEVQADRVDARLAIALAICLDALQKR